MFPTGEGGLFPPRAGAPPLRIPVLIPVFLNRDSCYETLEFLFFTYREILQELARPEIFLSELVFVSRPGPAPAGPARPKGNFTVYEIQKNRNSNRAFGPPLRIPVSCFGPPSPVRN